MQRQLSGAGDHLMDAKPSLLALTPVVRCTPVPMQWLGECRGGEEVQKIQACHFKQQS